MAHTQVAHLEPLTGVDHAARRVRERKHAISTDGGPAETDQQPVRAGHVGDRVGGVAGVLARLPGEVHVDRVFGQHAQQREEQDRERLRDVALGELGGPREQEGAAQDREARRRRHQLGRQIEARKVMQRDPRNRERGGARDRGQIAPTRASVLRRFHQSGMPNSRSKRARSAGSSKRVFWVPSTST